MMKTLKWKINTSVMRLRSVYSILLIIISLNAVTEINAASLKDKLDSLKVVVLNQQNNVGKVESLLEIAKAYMKIDMDSAKMYANDAFALSNQLDYQDGIIEAYYRLGYIDKKTGNYKGSLEHFTNYMHLSEKMHDSSNMAKSYLEMGNVLRRLGKHRLALYYHRLSLEIYLDLNKTLGIISNYNSMGSLYKQTAQYDSAAYFYTQSLNLIKEAGLEANFATLYQNLGGLYRILGDYENAKKYLGMAIDFVDMETGKGKLVDIYMKLGNVASEEMLLDTALYYYKLAEVIYRELDDQRGINDLYINYGTVFKNKGIMDLAENNFNLALTYYKQQNIPEGMIVAWQDLASIYTERQEYAKALITLDSCLKLSQGTRMDRERLSTLLLISDIHYEMGNYRLSHDYYNKHITLKDSIYKLKREEIIADLRIRHFRKLDQAKILALENENLKKTRQRNRYLFGGIGIISLSIFLILYLRLTSRKNRIISEQRIRQLEEEKKLLAARFLVEGQEEERKRIATELHDGLGVLLSATKMHFTSIKDTKPENKPLIDKATKFLEQASSDVRKISHNMMPGLLTKLGLCEALEDLFEKLDESEGVTATCQIKGARERLPENQEIMIYRIVQEMVNNTLKHAQAQKIELRIDVLPDKLDVRYADDGKGFKVEEMLEKKSIGLQSIKSRVKFLDGSVSIESGVGKGTVYSLQIPVTRDA